MKSIELIFGDSLQKFNFENLEHDVQNNVCQVIDGKINDAADSYTIKIKIQ